MPEQLPVPSYGVPTEQLTAPELGLTNVWGQVPTELPLSPGTSFVFPSVVPGSANTLEGIALSSSLLNKALY